VANLNVTHTLTFQDANGGKASTDLHTTHPDTATLADLHTESNDIAAIYGAPGAANGISNAKLVGRTFTVQVDKAQLAGGTQPVTDKAYPLVQVQAQLNFADAMGARGRVSIPAPVDENVFGPPPGDDLVDVGLELPSANVSVAKLANWCTQHLTSADGAVLNLYQGGAIKGGKIRRRRARNWIGQ
jgi:hypothetical protein